MSLGCLLLSCANFRERMLLYHSANILSVLLQYHQQGFWYVINQALKVEQNLVPQETPPLRSLIEVAEPQTLRCCLPRGVTVNIMG
mmetsp:Transcript_91739/g.159109  ORF Transcript_91739/g.159109 Transcript_91739/m.159109 type:complete len:86 (+) Transcript_91739:254-511(+)